jgi:hypothetical protein
MEARFLEAIGAHLPWAASLAVLDRSSPSNLYGQQEKGIERNAQLGTFS